MNNQNTQDIGIIHESNIEVSDILEQVYEALSEKGYNPVSQIVGCDEWRSNLHYKLQKCEKSDHESRAG